MTRVEGTTNEYTSNHIALLVSHRYLVAVLASAIAVRLASYYLLHRHSFSSDVDMWLVSLISGGKLLGSYTSIWHYLGLAPYSYPVLFHLLLAWLKSSLELASSQLFLVNVIPVVVSLTSIYFTVNEFRGRGPALMSILALSTSPIFVFETLPNSFKAKPLCYAFIALALMSAVRVVRGRRRATAPLVLFLLASVFTYRDAIPISILILATVLSCLLGRSKPSMRIFREPVSLRLVSDSLSMLGASIFTVTYILYTPSLGLTETLVSGLMKQGPLLLFSIPGMLYEAGHKDTASKFVLTLTAIALTTALVNWKAAEAAPLFLAPLAGVGFTDMCRKPWRLKCLKLARGFRIVAVMVILVGLGTMTFGLTYYPSRYYVRLDPEVLDETDQIRLFVADRSPQRGMVVFGSGYTGLALGDAYASMIVLGEEQRLFFHSYNLHHLISTDFDPWIITHPELTYVSTIQLHRSLFSHNGRSLDLLFRSFFIQYVIAERNPRVDEWAQINQNLVKEILTTRSYRVFEVVSTRPQMMLLSFIERNIPADAKILAPYSASLSIGQLNGNDLTRALEITFNFNYIHLYEKLIGGPDRTRELQSVRTQVATLKNLYLNPERLVVYATEKGYGYIVSDSRHISAKLLELRQKPLFVAGDISLFEVAKTELNRKSGTNATATARNSTLAINVFETMSYSPDRYALGEPAANCQIRLEGTGTEVTLALTDSSGTAIFYVPPGEYVVEATMGDIAAKTNIRVESYTFVPMLLHRPKQDLTRALLPLMVILNGGLAAIAASSPLTRRTKDCSQ